ncbi:hypothetical protein SLS62_000279 [Diatrype stigma]|uniref:Triacylglycerol lipase n=1 Tax=Diatrype stigma TaxID=117547 RepID=A0AAN9V1L8_9PEZI
MSRKFPSVVSTTHRKSSTGLAAQQDKAATSAEVPKQEGAHLLHTFSPPAAGSPTDSMAPLNWLFGLCAVPQPLSSSTSQTAGQPLPPSQDPWYRPPVGFEAKEPGTLLRIRPTPGNLTTLVGNTAAAYNILYRTTNSRYLPSWAVTTLFVPASFYVSPSGKAAMLSYQFAYNTANLDSSPSYGLHLGPSQGNADLGIQSDTSFLTDVLGLGWLVNVPDWEGPTAAFGAAVQAGHATLDSIRAVLNLAQLTGAADITTTMWGYSGGSIATESAAELQVQYAPSLAISGVALGGLVDDLAANRDRANQSPIAASIVAGLLGLASQYPEAEAYLRRRLRPETAREFLSAKDINSSDALRLFAMKDIYSYFVGGVADLQAPVLRKIFNLEGKRGSHGVPAMPIFMYKAVADQFCPISLTDALVERFCSSGVDITYERNTVGGHVAEIENGNSRVIEWLWKIFDESYVPSASGCTIRDVAVNISTVNA